MCASPYVAVPNLPCRHSIYIYSWIMEVFMSTLSYNPTTESLDEVDDAAPFDGCASTGQVALGPSGKEAISIETGSTRPMSTVSQPAQTASADATTTQSPHEVGDPSLTATQHVSGASPVVPQPTAPQHMAYTATLPNTSAPTFRSKIADNALAALLGGIVIALTVYALNTVSASTRDLGYRVNDLNASIIEIHKNIYETNARVTALEDKVDNLDTRVGNLETKVDNLETKVDNLETKMDNLETKVDNLETKMDNLETKVDAKFTEMDAKITAMDVRQEEIARSLAALVTVLNARSEVDTVLTSRLSSSLEEASRN